MAKLFEAARKQGAMEADNDDDDASSQNRKEKPFGGVGYTLGKELNDETVSSNFRTNVCYSVGDDRTPSRSTGQTSAPSGGAAAAAGSTPGRAEQVPLRFFSNGFTVGESELRSYHENQEFMDHIKRGEVPPELRNLSSGGKQVEVMINRLFYLSLRMFSLSYRFV